MKKRAVERIPVNLKAEFFFSDNIIAGEVVDLSENGFLVKTDTCPPMKAKLDLNVKLNERDFVKIGVKVRRVVKNERFCEAVGLEIVAPPREYLAYVDALRWERIKGVRINGQLIKLYVCRECYHIAFDYAPVRCPICSSTIESFEKAPDAIKKPENTSVLSEFEKKHIPVVKLVRENEHVDAHISVGEICHNMNIDDHISHIDFYFNTPFMSKKCISRLSFNCERIQPSATLSLDTVAEGVLTVISRCNAHGSWLTRVNL